LLGATSAGRLRHLHRLNRLQIEWWFFQATVFTSFYLFVAPAERFWIVALPLPIGFGEAASRNHALTMGGVTCDVAECLRTGGTAEIATGDYYYLDRW
ncbi:MAG: hypothetical protein P8N17_05280, partial [Luminiphilus sp.]|nr:hypothetical protein [Luminiphilus sp.]